MLENIKRRTPSRNFYKDDVKVLGLEFFTYYEAEHDKYASKTRLWRDFKVKLNKEQLNKPHAFFQSTQGYYPVWELEKVLTNYNDLKNNNKLQGAKKIWVFDKEDEDD